MAIAASAFPRLSPNGLGLLAGEHVIVRDRTTEIGRGTSAQWATDDVFYYVRQPDGIFMRWANGRADPVGNLEFNAFSVGSDGRWAGYSAARGGVIFDNRPDFVFSEWSGPAISADPSVWAALVHATGRIQTVNAERNQVVTPFNYGDSDCRDLRFAGTALAWNVFHDGRWQIAGQLAPGAWPVLLNVEREEFWPVPFWLRDQLWLLTYSHTRLLLRPWGATRGYIVAVGNTFTPDARALADGRIRIVWDAGRDVLGERIIDPSEEFVVDLTTAMPQVDTTSVVDVLEYLPIGVTLDGSHLFGMNVVGTRDGRQIFSIAKHPDGGGEWWAYDEKWVYHHLDQSGSPIEEVISGRFTPRLAADGSHRLDAYHFAPDARFMPRRIMTGDSISVDTQIRYQADGLARPWHHTNSFRVYRSFPTPHGALPGFDIRYDPRTARDLNGRLKGNYEIGAYCSSPDGRLRYVSWGAWRTKDDNSGDEPARDENGNIAFREFTNIVNTPVSWRPSRRPADAPLLPTEGMKIGMTILEPSKEQFAAGVVSDDKGRLRCVCGPGAGEGWASSVRWRMRYVGESREWQVTDWRNPNPAVGGDNDHTFKGDRDYEVGLEWESGETGLTRVVRVPRIQVPPVPPVEPKPVEIEVNLQTSNRQNWIRAEGGGGQRLTAAGPDPSAWQTFMARYADDGRLGFYREQNDRLYWWSARDDGTLACDQERGRDYKPEGRQAFTVVQGTDEGAGGGVGLRTDLGTLVTASNGGGGVLRHKEREGAAGDETFFPSVPLMRGAGAMAGGIVGRLRREGIALFDDRGFCQPFACHSGTAIADLLYAPADEEHNLELIAAHNFPMRRVWTRLRGDRPWSNNPWGWMGREFGHETMGDRAYVDLLVESFRRHQNRGMKLVLSAGDIMGIDSEREIRHYVDLLCEALGAVSPDGSLCAIFEGGNELPGIWPTGSPQRAADWIVKPFKARFPDVLCTISQGANEGGDERRRWFINPADMEDIHSFRDNHWWDWIRHIINNAYVHEAGHPPAPIIWGSEPFGTGGLVSVQPNRHEYDEAVAKISFIAHWMTGQIPCYFCSPGIRYDAAREFYGETYETMPGFATVAQTAGMLPDDVFTWPRENIVHGGRPDPPGNPNPVFEEPGLGSVDRAYHTFSPDQRRVAALIFGPENPFDSRHFRGVEVEREEPFANKARLVVGRV